MMCNTNSIIYRVLPRFTKPLEGTLDYMDLKNQKPILRLPLLEVPHKDPQMDFLDEHKKMLISKEIILQKFANRKLKIIEQWADILTKEQEFHERFKRCSVFFESSASKRLRTRKKIIELKESMRLQQIENDKLHSIIDRYKEVNVEMKRQLARHFNYVDYLELVKEISEFRSSTDIINRFEMLNDLKTLILNVCMERQKLVVNSTATLKEWADKYNSIIDRLKNDTSQLRAEYERARSKCRYWEDVTILLYNDGASRMYELHTALHSIQFLYFHMKSRNNLTLPLVSEEIFQQLCAIKNGLGHLTRVKGVVSKESTDGHVLPNIDSVEKVPEACLNNRIKKQPSHLPILDTNKRMKEKLIKRSSENFT